MKILFHRQTGPQTLRTARRHVPLSDWREHFIELWIRHLNPDLPVMQKIRPALSHRGHLSGIRIASGGYRDVRRFVRTSVGLLAVLMSVTAFGTTYRWASSSNRIYVDGPGTATLTEIKAALPKAPLSLVNATNKVWYCGANLIVEYGAKLNLYGTAIGGDVSELRLKSDNNSSSNAIVELRADWGWLDIRNTKITSWDNAVNGPDTEIEPYRRAYVRARSTMDPDGVTAHESRMDVMNSEICYLGSHHAESYGLVWKVVETGSNYLSGDQNIFNYVNVYGDILNSHLHHNFFGMYSYGHYGGHWATNEVDHNIGYGFDPHDDSDYLVIENNNVHDNEWHGIIASKRCDHAIIRNNLSWANGKNGIMLHRHCDDSIIEGNRSFLNVDSGIALFDDDRVVVRNNLCESNLNAGIRLSVGCMDNRIEGNEVSYTGTYGLYLYQGSDPPEPDDADPTVTGRCRFNTFTNNFVHHYGGEAIKTQFADTNLFVANTFVAGATTLRFESSMGNMLLNNSLPTNVLVKLAGSSTNGTFATIKDQPLFKLQMDNYSTAVFQDDGGAIFDFAATNLATIVDGAGSFISVTLSDIGVTSSFVRTRNLFVLPGADAALVVPTAWYTTGNLRKAWTVQAASGTTAIDYTVGDLAPGIPYEVFKDSTDFVGLFLADENGFIRFSSIPGTTGITAFTVDPF